MNSSSLALRRKQLGYEQKQIAVLLGHKTTYQICRYETGQRIPSFKEAIKLAILCGLPVEVLFGSYFRHAIEELENTIKNTDLVAKINPGDLWDNDYCSYLELMKSTHISEGDADRVRRHIKLLVEERSKKMSADQ